jgi:hypothetical protein
MRQRTNKPQQETPTLVSSAELAEIVGVDFETINNWIRRGVIARALIGGGQLRTRLFSTDEVYKAALIAELVSLGIAPSSASGAMDAIWGEWDGAEASKGWKLYAVVMPIKGKWTAILCSQRVSGGPLCQNVRSGRVEMELPRQAFAVMPISDIFERASRKMSALLDGGKR